jgi:alpha-L-rhamnosidase
MTSFNHYALGAVADWMHRRVAGLAPGDPGYRTIVVRPLFTSHLTSASAKHLTPYGEAAVSWTRSDGQVRLSVTVPVGARAEVAVPGEEAPAEVGHGTHEWTADDRYDETPALPADPSIRQLMDHEPSWDTMVAAARETAVVADDAELAARLERYLDQPANQLVEAISPRGFGPDAEALQAKLDALLDN